MTKTRDLSDFLIEGGADLPLGVPHIIPGVLYPSYVASGTSNKLLDGTTDHSGAFGTEQSDGRKYYYTNIAGSKPIKDPRIGGHFGSQRYKFKSLQLLEQETATQGNNVYSVDGREWIRCVGGVVISNGSAGHRIDIDPTTSFIEIIGFFSDINYIPYVTGGRGVRFTLDGGTEDTTDRGQASVSTPLISRYVDSGSVVNLPISTSLGIHTVKLRASQTHSARLFGIELIAQDTTSTANRSKIQIPSQNVVSHGKKFNVSGTPHYDPFNGFTSGSSVSSYIDTATSLGVEKWKNSSTYYRPYNGGRVVKWVDSSGVIKTSVTLMPPNAKSIGNSSSLTNGTAKANASASNDTFYPTFEAHTTDVNEDNLHEVAKTFHFREFGNGSANGTITGNYPDASMLDTGTNRDVAYVMDDGLTSLSGDDVRTDSTRGTIRTDGINDTYYITFIGTGFTFTNQSGGTTFGSGDDFDFIVDGVVVKSWQSGSTINEKTTVVQNLPYGTHVFQMLNTAAPAVEHMHAKEFTFHQPKRPPIPEDACVLADYMLMADYVANTGTGQSAIGKGVRFVDASRDIFYDQGGSTWQFQMLPNINNGARIFNDNNSTSDYKLPFFGHGITYRSQSHTDRIDEAVFKINDDVYDTNFNSAGNYVAGNRIGTASPNPWDTTNNDGTFGFRHGTLTNREEFVGVKELQLGLNELHIDAPQYINVTTGMEVHTPIHTSHHYQSFETPFLHELVGGDRNMEQNNLVVSPDGKTWDQLTRDTSYIGKAKLQATRDAGDLGSSEENFITTLVRGNINTHIPLIQKDFALGYDRYICLKSGLYRICFNGHGDVGGAQAYTYIYVNGVIQLLRESDPAASRGNPIVELNYNLKRGDYIEFKGQDLEGNSSNYFSYVLINEL